MQAGHLWTLEGELKSLVIRESLLYIVSETAGLYIVDVSDAEDPTEIGNYNTQGYAKDVVVISGLAFVADERRGLRIIDVTIAEQPSETGYYDTEGDALGVAADGAGLGDGVADHLALVGDEHDLVVVAYG